MSLPKEIRERITPEMENDWQDVFECQALYVGNGIYKIGNLHSTDTRELFLMLIAQQEFKFELD